MVRQLRLQRGLTQERLAELAGDNPNHLSLVENGKVNVTIDGLTRIAGGLSVPVIELFGPVSLYGTGVPAVGARPRPGVHGSSRCRSCSAQAWLSDQGRLTT